MKNLRIFVSHSFDHPDKLLRVQDFIEMRNIQHVDYSVPVWDPVNDSDPQFEIERRIRESDRVLVILTDEAHESPWISQEVVWARQYGKPVIGIWPNGEAGSPVPEDVLEANAHLIGWRATSLEKALMMDEVADYRALDIVDDGDFDRAVHRIVGSVGAVSLLLIGYQLDQARKLQQALRERGVGVDLVDDPWEVARPAIVGAGIGALLMAFVGWIFGRSRRETAGLTVLGALVGTGFGVHRYFRVRVREFKALTLMEFEEVNGPKALGPA